MHLLFGYIYITLRVFHYTISFDRGLLFIRKAIKLLVLTDEPIFFLVIGYEKKHASIL